MRPLARPDEAEVARQLQVCNACRYCEGYCAVFPAMTRRLEFAKADVHYLANLCHGCGACLHACQYAPPHEFAVNVPRAMARVRRDTYATFAWPRPLGALYRRNGLAMALALAAGFALFLAIALARNGSLFAATVTDAPSRARRIASAFPIPRLAPVTIAARPRRSGCSAEASPGTANRRPRGRHARHAGCDGAAPSRP